MLALMLKEGFRRALRTPVHSVSLSKRGLCTFVERATRAALSGAAASVCVNTDNTLPDMPQGKENLKDCTVPAGIMREADGTNSLITAMTNEVIAVITDSRYEYVRRSVGKPALCMLKT
jgi:hypothetical protein